MTTLKDIAREAGVSITTVSNVVHKRKSRISPELFDQITEIIKRENYIPSMLARTLANKSSPIIGIINHVISSDSKGFLSDPFHNTFMDSVEEIMRDKGYFIMVRTVKDSRGLEEMCRNWSLAGMIFVGLYMDEFFESVQKIGLPFVLIDSYINLPDIYNIGLEDQTGAYIATKHLIENGHRVIAFTSPFIRDGGVVELRLRGYKQALDEFGIAFDKNLVFEQEIDTAHGIELGRRLGAMPNITSIFATADILAAGIMSGLRDVGVRVPDDKSIVGFDDNYLCQVTNPRLTTIHQDADNKGVLAAEMMLAQLEGKNIKNKSAILPVRLIERDSVRKR
ncbi:MAG: LacI family transcriptional regulator [Oscillospiraceae bacterium]|jgi:LacI family transcriptional regulator|nr:LacI family transcriptional regulator [Oscillospiraceae bacterium]